MDGYFFDFSLFYEFGKALLNGNYVGDYPFPMCFFFAFFALFPKDIAMVIFTGMSLICFVATFKRKSLLWSMYLPVTFTLVTGQVDLFALYLMDKATPLSLALLTLKPHLFLFAIPKINRTNIVSFIKWCVVIYGTPTLIRPYWILEFISRLGNAADGDMTLVAFPALCAFVILLSLLIKKNRISTILCCLNPNMYHIMDMVMVSKSKVMIPASFVSFYLYINCRELAVFPLVVASLL